MKRSKKVTKKKVANKKSNGSIRRKSSLSAPDIKPRPFGDKKK